MTIELSSSNGPLHIIASNQPIAGTVHFSNTQNRPSGIVTVTLAGNAETSFSKGRTVYSSIATLFTLSLTLHSGPLPKNQYSWPFHFTFPSATSGETKKWLDVPPFQVAEGHSLPPSMVFNSEDFDNNTGKGAVTYSLQCSFSKSAKSSIFSPAESAVVVLYHIPSRKFDVPDARLAVLGKETFTCSSKSLDPAAAAAKAKSSFFKRLKDKTPRAVFEIKITTPHTVYVGGPLPITLALNHDLTTSTAPETPVVKLTSCTVSVLRTVHAVGRSILEEDGKFMNTEAIFERAGLDIPLSATQNLSEILGLEGGFKTRFGMSFATYNLAQTFKLMVKVTVECAGKPFWAELRSRNVIVLSPFTRELLEKGGGNPRALLAGMHDRAEDGSDLAAAGAGLFAAVLGIALDLI